MAASESFTVHGESITDGDSSGGVAVTLYNDGSVDERSLKSNEVLRVTDIQIASETGGDTWLCADDKVAGESVWHGALDAKDVISVHLSKPFVCAKGTGLVFFGAASNISSCIIEGFIREA